MKSTTVNKLLFVGVIACMVLAGADLSFYLQEQHTDLSIATCSMPGGNFKIIPHNGWLEAVNVATGAVLGIPEREKDGAVWLRRGLWSIDVTTCLGRKRSWFAPRSPVDRPRQTGVGIS